MRCVHCNIRLSRFMGVLKTKAVVCPDPACGAALCVHCLPEMVETHEEGLGPLRRAVLEVYCPECEGLLHRREFPSGLEQAARSAFYKGKDLTREIVVKPGRKALRRFIRRGRE